MKKILVLVLALTIVLVLSACGNRSYGLGNYSFKHVHFTDAVNGYCATVEKWYESEGSGIEVKTMEYGAIWCSEGTYMLFESDAQCPYCK